ncbi:SGNH/GDSL hydrolase family protein [Paenibacillus abyssi]|uniref:Uncharacterized protein n=1 Tax=Paenibacillus abyssi TaxID=1340531 RepID=A0A917CH80_9BACL|nr:hypothetical protein [Paenibacillus abyssi]GGF88415.1 hypothetical protein GCM10010916_02190 [Paenibacillus abyssi]
MSRFNPAPKDYSSATTAANTRMLLAKLRRGVSDAAITVIGDSTGNAPDEWVYLTAQNLAAMFPAYTVRISTWNATTGTEYNAAETLQTGTGPYTLRIWNCSVPGEIPGYVQGFRWQAAVVATAPDLIFISHGHNLGDPTPATYLESTGRNTYLSLTEELTLQFPLAGLVLIAQNPTTLSGRETWQAIKANVIESVASMRSYGFIDVHQAFVDTMNVPAYLSDGIHPNTAGSKLWASLVTKVLIDSDNARARTGMSSLLLFGKNYLSNPEFSSWAATDPDSWVPNASAATSKDTTTFETGAQGCKVTSNATSGTAQIEQTINLATAGLLHLRGKTVTLAVRVFVPAGNTATVRIAIVDSTGGANARNMDVPGTTRGRYIWLFSTRVVDSAATTIFARLMARTSGTAIVEATFDRAYLVQGVLPTVGLV